MKIGDLVWYGCDYRTTDGSDDNTYNVPGIVVNLNLDNEDDRIIVVQWLDWEAGTFANEDPEVLEVLSEGR